MSFFPREFKGAGLEATLSSFVKVFCLFSVMIIILVKGLVIVVCFCHFYVLFMSVFFYLFQLYLF